MAITLDEVGSSSGQHHHQQPDNITASVEIHGSVNTLQNGAVDQVDEIAYEIPGIELKIPSPMPNEDPIQIVYASNNITSTTAHKTPKGIVLLLHACTHSALKFFSPSPSACPNCLGLSEELRIVRITIERGYMPVAVSCVDRKSGCWSMSQDVYRIEQVLKHDFVRAFLTTERSSIFAVGASSGGAFAAELATRGIVDAALVMVMSLSDGVTGKLRNSPKPIYLAPMPRDEGMTKMEGGDDGRRRGNSASLHVTFFMGVLDKPWKEKKKKKKKKKKKPRGEGIDNLCYVGNHVNLNFAVGGKIEIHTKVVMARATDNVQFLVLRVISLRKPIKEGGDNGWVMMTDEKVINMPANS
ncbi:hypothetical protein ACHAXA_002560 [Cyclostephanos tholiformis]|uniref:Uncharacterized protein n=1 Tax=Cyclostephanos tholiformis TaxID=382380 RepID=A0ABD3R1Q8_9STRA